MVHLCFIENVTLKLMATQCNSAQNVLPRGAKRCSVTSNITHTTILQMSEMSMKKVDYIKITSFHFFSLTLCLSLYLFPSPCSLHPS